ncbi:MAG TPA: MFS transporter [Rubrobacter sp.]|jgi:DHA1 family multidrug resistance protein-like MFS transporter
MKSLRVDGRLSFVVLLVSQLAATMGFTFVLPFMPIYVQALGVEDAGHAAAWAGVINSSTAVTMALAAPLWGKLGDRVGLKPMLLRATVAGSIVIGLMGLVGSPWQLLALKTLQGCLTGTVAAATVLVSATAPAERAGARLGTLQMVIFVAAAAGPFFGGVFADLVGIRASFGVTAALLAASAVLISIWVKEERSDAEKEGEESVAAEGSLPYRKLAPSLLALFVVQVAIMSAAPAMPGLLSALMDKPVRVATLAGWVIATGALAASVGSVAAGKLAARFGARKVIIWTLLLAGISALPQAGVDSVAMLWALRLLTGLFVGTAIPVANLAIRDSAHPGRQGEAFGVAGTATSTGNAIGPLAGGLLASSFGFGAPFLVPGVCLVVVSAIIWGTPLLAVGYRTALRDH